MAHCYCTRGTVKCINLDSHLGLYTYRIVMTQYFFVITPDTRGMSVWVSSVYVHMWTNIKMADIFEASAVMDVNTEED